MRPVPLEPPSAAMLAVLFVLLPYLAARTHLSGKALSLPRPALYVSAVLTQLMLLPLLAVVLKLEGRGLESLGLGPAPGGGGAVLAAASATRATALAVAAGLGIGVVLWGVRRLLGRPESATVRHLVPRTRGEKLLFAFLVAPTAGLVEELLYRGLAVSRLASVAGGPWPAALLAAAAFAAGHVYQGPLGFLRSFLLGLVLSAPFVWTGWLVPSILVHLALDLLGGLALGRFLLDAGTAPEGPAVGG